MLTYNTQLKDLILPEYGRNIQEMVDHCLTIEDREERNRCAYTIVKAMSVLCPLPDKTDESKRKLWDHLAIMSDFQLDIDYPYEIIQPDHLDTKPEPLSYVNNKIKYRHYGTIVLDLIAKAASMEPGAERDELVLLVANHMKKDMLSVNSDGVEDEKIFRDLEELSDGAIRLDPASTRLHAFQKAPEPAKSKRKKKK